MGSGKSTSGKLLADKLGFVFVDLDKIIEIYQGITIPEIFERYGEKYFRDVETEVIKKIYGNSSCVFACGGGVVLKEENMKIIKENSTVIFLKVGPDEACSRLAGSCDRPLLKTGNVKSKIISLISEREDLYKRYADIIIDTDKISAEFVSLEILSYIGNL
jgi:shikimate kinase